MRRSLTRAAPRQVQPLLEEVLPVIAAEQVVPEQEMGDGAAAAAVLAHQRDLLNKLKAGNDIPKFTGGSSAYKSWTEGFHRLSGDLNDQQRIQLLRAKVHGTAGRLLDKVLDGDAYENAADDAARIAILQQPLHGT